MERRQRIGWLLLFILIAYLTSEALVSALIPGPVEAATGKQLRVRCLEVPTRLELEARSIQMEPALGLDLGNHVVIRWESDRHFVQRDGKDELAVDGPIHLTWSGVGTWIDRKDQQRKDIGSMTLTTVDGKPSLDVSVGIEAYLSGVLAREMNSRFPLEALKAQAVAARSFALNAAARRRKQGRAWDLKGGQSDMVYRGIDSSARILRAIQETRGQVLAFNDKVLRAYFAATCGGTTRDGSERFRDVPATPFRSVVCTGCVGLGLYRWSRKIDRAKIDKLIPGLAKGGLQWKVQTRSARGDWIQFKVRGSAGPWKSGDMTSLRGKLRLPSTWITAASMKGKDVQFEGRGHGHGVGLCQNGAMGYAKAGWDYQRILAFYYNGTPLLKIGK